jgi:hypothetical protein
VVIDADAFIGRGDFRAGAGNRVERGFQKVGARAFQKNVAAGHGHGHGIGAGLDPVGNDAYIRAMQFVHALNGDGRGAGAGNLRAHCVEALGKVDDFRLAGGIFEHRLAAGEGGGHHQHVGGADGNLGEAVAVAAQPFACPGKHIARLDVDVGAQRLQAVDEQVDRPRADGAAARQRDLGFTHAGQKRADDPERGAHLRNQIVGCGGVDDVCGREVDGARIAFGLAVAATVDGIVDAMIAENPDELFHIGKMRNVLQGQRLARQQ